VEHPEVGGGPVVDLTQSGVSPSRIAIDATHIYWTDYNDKSVRSVPKAGGPDQLLAQEVGATWYVATDGVHAYYSMSSGSAGAIRRVPVGGGAAQTVVANVTGPQGIDVDATDVYFTTTTSVQKAPKAGGPATILATVSDARAVVVQGADVFFVDYNTCTVHRVAKAGGAVAVLGASTISACTGLAVDALHAYAPGSNGLSRWPVGGGAGEIVAPLFGADVALGATRVFLSSAPYILEIPK
jgi:hypothetical protein